MKRNQKSNFYWKKKYFLSITLIFYNLQNKILFQIIFTLLNLARRAAKYVTYPFAQLMVFGILEPIFVKIHSNYVRFFLLFGALIFDFVSKWLGVSTAAILPFILLILVLKKLGR
jgi:hypothetical protein